MELHDAPRRNRRIDGILPVRAQVPLLTAVPLRAAVPSEPSAQPHSPRGCARLRTEYRGATRPPASAQDVTTYSVLAVFTRRYVREGGCKGTLNYRVRWGQSPLARFSKGKPPLAASSTTPLHRPLPAPELSDTAFQRH